MSEHDVTWEAMGSHVRLIIGEPTDGRPAAPGAAEKARLFLKEFEAVLSRFREDSELCALNADPRSKVPASKLLRDAVSSGLRAAELSDGLVDPTLVREIESVGYARSRAGIPAAPLGAALEEAPARRPARPSREARWRSIRVNDAEGTICRPHGVAFDTGGTGKGLAADMVADTLAGYTRFVVDCGGDIRIGGTEAKLQPFEVHVEHPLTGEQAHVLHLSSGAVATSGMNVRIWRGPDGRYAHHLLDPSTGEPAWTGLIGATALAPTAVEAETLSKAALLSGPEGAREALAKRGGLIVHDNGRVELVGPLTIRPRIRIPSSPPQRPAPGREQVAA